jgi:alpha-L-rhamnosidase
VAEWLYGTVAGIDLAEDDPKASGWRRVRLAPRPPIHAGLPEVPVLTQASAKLHTVSGRYEVAWRIREDRFHFDARVPAGTSAHLELPDGTTEDVAAGVHHFEITLDSIRAGD